MGSHLVAALCSDVWQNRKRTSFSALVKAYLLDISAIERGGRAIGVAGKGGDRSIELYCHASEAAGSLALPRYVQIIEDEADFTNWFAHPRQVHASWGKCV